MFAASSQINQTFCLCGSRQLWLRASASGSLELFQGKTDFYGFSSLKTSSSSSYRGDVISTTWPKMAQKCGNFIPFTSFAVNQALSLNLSYEDGGFHVRLLGRSMKSKKNVLFGLTVRPAVDVMDFLTPPQKTFILLYIKNFFQYFFSA